MWLVWLARITGISDVWVKVRNLLTKPRLLSHQRREWIVLPVCREKLDTRQWQLERPPHTVSFAFLADTLRVLTGSLTSLVTPSPT